MYSINFNNEPVGKAQVKQEGLYYIIRCQCVVPDKDIYRIVVSDGENDVDLGICVPDGGRFVLTTRVAMKKLSGKHLKFMLSANHTSSFPVENGETFDGLDKLEAARLQRRNGQLYVVID